MTTQTVIDHLITNVNTRKINSGVIYYDISDHLPIFGLFDLYFEKQKKKKSAFWRFYSSAGKKKYIEDVALSMQSFIDSDSFCEDPEENLQNIISSIKISEDKALPMRKISGKKSHKMRKSWMTCGILQSMKHRDKLFSEQLGKNDEQLSKKYRKFRNKVNRICLAAMDLECYNSFKDIVDNPKKVWCKINKKFLNKKHCSSTLPSEIIKGNTLITNENDILDAFNTHFVEKGPNLASDLPEPVIPILSSMKSRNLFSVTKWDKIQPQEIIRKDILANKSSGYDDMSAQLVKWSMQHIAPVLSKVFNKFIDLGRYPNILKIAKVVALHKGGDRSKVDNYRPISVLTHFNKIFEKCIHKRLIILLLNTQY